MTEQLINEFFSSNGPLAKTLDNFEERTEQREMANAVYQALNQQYHLMIEAGTGVGKSLAYLMPASLWTKLHRKKVLISTYTKILQNQLIKKDIPLLKKVELDETNFAVVFGQENYVCLRRLNSAFNHGLFDTPYEYAELEALQRWLNNGGSGIILEYPDVLGRTQEKISRDADICKFQKCQFYDDCYYFQARKEWMEADILITNHALFFANVESNYYILPKFDAVIFDEAHRLEEVAAHFFGIEISNLGIQRMLNTIYNAKNQSGIVAHLEIQPFQKREIGRIVDEARSATDAMFQYLLNLIPQSETKIRIKQPIDIENQLDKILITLGNNLLQMQSEDIDEDIELELKSCLKRLEVYRMAINEFLQVGDKNSVYWIETANSTNKKIPHIYLSSALIDIAELFRQRVLEKISSVILTSATLTVSKDFSFVKGRLGLDKAKTLKLDSPFNYQKQALLVIPTNLSLPIDEDKFLTDCADVINKILKMTKGRALVLFTSYNALEKTFQLIDKSEFPFLIQGQAATFELLEKFKNDIASVLFATQSFWQGIDVPGEALSCLIIVRLPFDVPDDPRLEGICEKMRADKLEPFTNYQLPNAVLRFRQGFGRLIRNKQDRGVVCVLDKRIVTKEYGKQFLNSLPKNLPITFSVENIKDFFENE
ncbi:MAG: helicase C-terminal domain-containing protein [candidate division WOR-3 bacterium]